MQNDLSIKVMAATDFGPEGNIGRPPRLGLLPHGEIVLLMRWLWADFDVVDAVVDATHRYHEIFYQRDQ